MTDYFNQYFHTISEQFLTIIHRGRKEHQVFQRLLIYRQVLLSRENLSYDEQSSAQQYLLKFGFIIQRGGQLKITSPIHSDYFDEEWIQRQLEQNDIYKRILYWAEKDELLVNKLCDTALNSPSTMQQDEYRQWVDELVKNQIVNGWENGNEQYHRSWIEINNQIRDTDYDLIDIRSALELYKKIFKGYELAFNDRNRIQQILLNFKLVKNEEQRLKIAKRIYILVFNLDWVQREIEKLPPPIVGIIHRSRTNINTFVDWIKDFFRRFFRRIRLPARNVILSLVFILVLVIILALQVEVIKTTRYKYLQEQGEKIVKDFATYQTKQLDSLSLAIQYGQELKKLLNKNYFSLSEYPAISPVYALRYIIDNIYEKNIYERNSPNKNNGSVYSVNFSSEDKLLAFAGDYGSLRLWNLLDISKSRLFLKEKIDQGIITIVNFVPTQQLITTIGHNKPTIKFWNFSGENVRSNQEQIYEQGEITSAKFSPDGRLLATIGSQNNLLKIWKIYFDKTAKEVKEVNLTELKLKLDSKNIENIAFLREYKNYNLNEYIVAILENTNKIKLCKIDVQGSEIVISDKEECREWDTQQTGVKSISFSPDGKLIVTAAKDRTIKLWDLDLNSNKISFRETIDTNESKELNISISSDNKFIAAGGENGEIQLWRIIPKVEKIDLGVKLNLNQKRIYSINFNRNNSTQDEIYLAAGGESETVKLWKMSKLYHEPFLKVPVKDIVIGQTRDSRQRLVILQKDEKIQSCNLENKNCQDVFKGKSIAISPDKNNFAVVNDNAYIQLYDFSNNEKLKLSVTDNIEKVILSNTDKLVTIQNAKAQLRDFGGNLNESINYSQDEVMSASFSPNNKIIATGDRKGKIKLWDLQGKLINKDFFNIHGEVISVKFTSKSNYIVTININNEMKLWRLADNFFESLSQEHLSKNVSLLQPETVFSETKVKMADFSSNDGEFANILATADDGKIVKIWDFKGRQLAEFRGSWNQTVNISFSPNGKYIVAAGDNGTVERWEIKNLDSLLKEGCNWFKDYEDYEDYSLKLNSKKRDKDRLCSRQTLHSQLTN